MTQDVTNLQDLNRYAYVTDNPLSLTDPTGYVHNGGGFFKTPLAHELEGIAVAVLLDQWFLPAVIEPMLGLEVAANTGQVTVLSTINAGISGGASGAVSTGTLKGAALGAAEAIAFAGVHFAKTNFLNFAENGAATSTTQIVESAGMHAMVGGLFSMAGGGRFSSGFLAGGFSDAAGAVVPDTGMIGNTVTASVAGGLGSMLAAVNSQMGLQRGRSGTVAIR